MNEPSSYHIVQHELGIGDIVCSLYGVNGFSAARRRPPIVLHLRDHREWLALIDIPNLRVAVPGELIPPGSLQLGDSEADYREKLRGAHDPKRWYARKLAAEPMAPQLRHAPLARAPELRAPYIVLAPFATRINRTWEAHHWMLLARELRAAGYHVIALDAPDQPERCKSIGVDYYWGQTPTWVGNVCHHAALVISGDSGIAHIAGLLGAPTLVLLTQQLPKTYYSLTANQFVVPEQRCVGCRFQADRGYEPKCDYGCWALQSLSPRTVAERALRMLQSRAT
jgi:ADP-heptose:LPS heptosyltransferase